MPPQQQQQQQQACSSSRGEVKGENEVARAGPSAVGFPHPPSAMGQLSELLNSENNNIFDWAFEDGSNSPPEHAWLHLEGGAPDTTQDSLRRPPAA